MTAKIIDGKAVAAKVREQIAQDIQKLKAKGVTPGLAVIQVGHNPASEVYVRNKVKTATEIGMHSVEKWLPDTTTQDELLAQIRVLNSNPTIHGILVQLPLPKHMDEKTVLETIDPRKDVDGFHAINVGKLWTGQEDALVSCTPLGCSILLKEAGIPLAGKHAVVIGRSNIVGKPMAALLLKEHCTVTIAHSRTDNLPEVVRGADIVIAAVGKPEMVKGSWIKPGAIIIDVGINRTAQEGGKDKLVGDVAYAECAEVAAAITPVPGGVGPMTIACLLMNTVTAAKRISAL